MLVVGVFSGVRDFEERQETRSSSPAHEKKTEVSRSVVWPAVSAAAAETDKFQ